MSTDTKPQLRWFREYFWTARAGSYAREWPRNAELQDIDKLQFFDGNDWADVPLVHGTKPEAP